MSAVPVVFAEPPSFWDRPAWLAMTGARFADPAPVPFRAGLGPATCVDCHATTLAVDGFTTPRCEACWRVVADGFAQRSAAALHRGGSILGQSIPSRISCHEQLTLKVQAPAGPP